ncbi:MAG: acyltransferase family protein [Ramlibacter sp.]
MRRAYDETPVTARIADGAGAPLAGDPSTRIRRTAPAPEAATDLSHHHRPDIDGLRALAVGSVIVSHISKTLMPSGHLGVDIFFVISGFVITASLWGRTSRGPWAFFIDFYGRRVKRLYPALLPVVVASAVAICLFNPEPAPSLKTGIAALFGVSNVQLWLASANYFEPSSDLNVFTHTWSLGVEEQFYLLYPAVAWLTALGWGARNAKRLVQVLAVVGLASLAAYLTLCAVHPASAFFLMPARLWELAAGCLLFFWTASRRPPRPHDGVALLALGLLVAALFMPLHVARWTTIAVVALTTLVIGSVRTGSLVHRMLTRPAVVYVGAISYSLYLWHWPVVSVSRWTIGITPWTVPFQLALILLLASASYRWLETPIRRSPHPRRMWVAVGSAAVASAAFAGTLVMLNAQRTSLFLGLPVQEEEVGTSALLRRFPQVIAAVTPRLTDCNMTPHLLTGKRYRPRPRVDAAFLDRCLHGSGGPAIVLVGDSFAQASAPHVAVVAQMAHRDFRVLFGYGCPYPLLFEEMSGATARKCPQVDVSLVRERLLANLEPGDILVLRLYMAHEQYLRYRSGQLPPDDAYDRAIRSLADAVQAKGVRLVLLGGNATLSPQHVQSLRPQWFYTAGGNSTVVHPSDNVQTAYFHRLDAHLERFLAGDPNVRFFSFRKALCGPDESCSTVLDGVPLYADRAHLTAYAHDLSFPALRAAVGGQ